VQVAGDGMSATDGVQHDERALAGHVTSLHRIGDLAWQPGASGQVRTDASHPRSTAGTTSADDVAVACHTRRPRTTREPACSATGHCGISIVRRRYPRYRTYPLKSSKDMCSGEDLEQPVLPQGEDPSLEELEREICELAAHIAAATCRWLLLVAQFDERRGWAQWGMSSCAQWLSWRCSIGPVAAREHVRVARALGELALVRAAFAAGELSYCKVRAITRVATAQTEEQLVELARHATGAQLERLVRGYRGALAATLEAAQDAHAARSLSWEWEEDGSAGLTGRLPADEGALLLAALEAAQPPAPAARAEPIAPEDACAQAERTPTDPIGARCADALVTLARAALASGRPSARAEIHASWSCTSMRRRSHPLSVARRARTISPALRRALRSRDRGCRFPGCTHRRFLHAHHIEHWARGGQSTFENLVQLCSQHHRLVHEGGYRVERAGPGSLCFRRPEGRATAPAPQCQRTLGRGDRRAASSARAVDRRGHVQATLCRRPARLRDRRRRVAGAGSGRHLRRAPRSFAAPSRSTCIRSPRRRPGASGGGGLTLVLDTSLLVDHLPGVVAAVAATAEHIDAALATRNLKHFPMFPGLRNPY
jgi:hypothetical protein